MIRWLKWFFYIGEHPFWMHKKISYGDGGFMKIVDYDPTTKTFTVNRWDDSPKLGDSYHFRN